VDAPCVTTGARPVLGYIQRRHHVYSFVTRRLTSNRMPLPSIACRATVRSTANKRCSNILGIRPPTPRRSTTTRVTGRSTADRRSSNISGTRQPTLRQDRGLCSLRYISCVTAAPGRRPDRGIYPTYMEVALSPTIPILRAAPPVTPEHQVN